MAFKFFLLAATLAVANAGLQAVTSTSDNIYRSQGNLAQVSTQSKSIETPYSSSSKTDVRVSSPAVYATAAPVYASPAPAVQYSAEPQVQYSHAPQVQYSSVPVAHGVQYSAQGAQAPVYSSAPGPVLAKTAYAVSAPVYHHAAPAPVSYSAPAYAHSAPVVHQVQPAYASYAPAGAYAASSYAHAAPVNYAQVAPQYAHAAPVNYAQVAPQYAHAAPVNYAQAAPQYAHQPLAAVAFSPASDVAHLTYSNVNDHINYAW